jgi:hypothetical protein
MSPDPMSLKAHLNTLTAVASTEDCEQSLWTRRHNQRDRVRLMENLPSKLEPDSRLRFFRAFVVWPGFEL